MKSLHSISEVRKLRLTELRTSSSPCRGKEKHMGGGVNGSPIECSIPDKLKYLFSYTVLR